MKRLAILILSVSLVSLSQGSAWAEGDGTVVLSPVRNKRVNPRYRMRVERSMSSSVKAMGKAVSMSAKHAGALTGTSRHACTLDPACLAKAGVKLGAARVVGVMVKTNRNRFFDITFVLVDVAAAKELSRSTKRFKKSKLRSAPGKLIKAFLAAAPAVKKPAPPPPKDKPEPKPEPKPEAKPEANPAPVPPPDPGVTKSAPAPASSSAGKKIHIGVQTGVVFPQLQSKLGTAIGGKLEAGMRVWKNLAPFASISYTQPSVDSDLMDPRVGDYTTATIQRELIATIGAMWRFFPAGRKLNVYAAAGMRFWFLETKTRGAVVGGSSFLQNTETSTRIGGSVAGGAEYRIGPGAVVGEVDVGGSDLPHLITGDVATTSIGVNVGYRLMF